jgi:hypothetical protein
MVTAGQAPVFADDDTAFAAISRPDVDFRKVIFLPPEAKKSVAANGEPSAKIIDKQFGNRRESIMVETPGPAMVYISQAYYHNWLARVDGKPVPLWRANYAFQAVEVPAGRHEITLIYRERMFWIGTLLAVWAGVICAAIWLAPGSRIKPAQP